MSATNPTDKDYCNIEAGTTKNDNDTYYMQCDGMRNYTCHSNGKGCDAFGFNCAVWRNTTNPENVTTKCARESDCNKIYGDENVTC